MSYSLGKRVLAEFCGTFVLVLMGCGAAVVVGGPQGGQAAGVLQVLTIAMAFGLSIVAAAYSIGDISGAHVNPAVSLAVWLRGGMKLNEMIAYWIGQFLGAIAGSGLLALIVSQTASLKGTGADGYGALSATGLSLTGALVAETVLTFIFVMVILGVTRTEKTASLAGIVIGLTLTFVHIVGIPLTGTSVNPARGLSAAIFAGGEALAQSWVFVVAPLVGALLAALVFRVFYPVKAVQRG